MAETLFIRLGSKTSDAISWLIFSANEQEVIASGELDNAEQLTLLTAKADQRQVTVFVPSCDIALKRLTVPGKSQRAIRMAAPYMLEDDLAQDVEQLFFAYANLPQDAQGHNCFVAAVERNQVKQWLLWLADAEIDCKVMIPDVLAMPVVENAWSAIMLSHRNNEQIILRQDKWQGFTVDSATWQVITKQWAQQKPKTETQENEYSTIQTYSSLPFTDVLNEVFTVEAMPEELPLVLLAQHSKNQTFNLLQGEFQIKEMRSNITTHWLWAAGFALFALLLNVGYKGAQLVQLQNQQQAIEQQIVSTYKRSFPKSKRVRVSTIKSQLNQKLAKLGGLSDQQGFLTMLSKVQPAFAKVPQLKPESLKFDGKRQELRLQAIANDYQHFDLFKNALEQENLQVKQGAQNNQGEQVSGSFSISYKKISKKKRNSRGRS